MYSITDARHQSSNVPDSHCRGVSGDSNQKIGCINLTSPNCTHKYPNGFAMAKALTLDAMKTLQSLLHAVIYLHAGEP